ncbi:MAG: methionine adenosyltransferase [Nitrospirae bacterium]|nr:MAG: methionine adenosyltransferase [Nitrospirota bacterium]
MSSSASVDVLIDAASSPSPAEQPFEVVERKGKGHPDTICDAIAEQISIELSRAYQATFGCILHHNIDKGVLVAGRVDCRLGGGTVLEPMRLIIGDRATWGIKNKRIPVEEIAQETARRWFREHLPHIDPERHVTYQVELKPASAELSAIFSSKARILVANDTSAAVGYAPLTPTERLVLAVEQFLNSQPFKRQFPQTGEDVKVMALRHGTRLALTIAMPLLAQAISSEAEYFRLKRHIVEALTHHITDSALWKHYLEIRLNTLDRRGKGLDGMYLTLLGTSAEQGDSGQVGRGNRVNGVISLTRPASSEAAAGKNAMSHVGKIYNVFAHFLADHLYQQIPGLTNVTVWLTSAIGQRIDRPQLVAIQVNLAPGTSLRTVRPRIARLLQAELQHLPAFCQALAKGEYSVY